MKKLAAFLISFVLTSQPGNSWAASPVNVYDKDGNGITSTSSGGKRLLDVNATLTEAATAAPGAAQPALDKIAGGVDTGTSLAHPLNVDSTGKLNVNTTSVGAGATGSAVPANASYVAGNKSGNLTGLLIGQQTMANSLACVLPSDQSAIPVTGTFWQATQPVSAAALPLPTGASTEATLSTLNGKIPSNLTVTSTRLLVDGSGVTQPVSGTFWQATQPVSGTVAVTQSTSPWVDNITQFGGSNISTGTGTGGAGIPRVTVSSDSTVGLVAGVALIGKVGIDQTTPGTTNGVQVNAALPAGTNILGKVSIDQTTPGTTNLVSIGTNGTVQVKAPLNSTGSGSAAAATVSTVITLTAPANAVGAYLMNIDTSTANIRWAVNRTATATLGQQLQPGRSEWIQTSHDISLVAESGTQTYDVQWVSQ